MEIEVRRQLLQLAAAFAAGAALGLVYDAFRVLRRRSGHDAPADALFSFILIASMFTLGMSVGDGALNWSMALFSALGFAFYMLTLSGSVLRIMNRLADAAGNAARKCLKPLKKGEIFFRKCAEYIFSKIRKRFTMVKKSEGNHGDEFEEEKPHGYNLAYYGDTAVRGGKSYIGGGGTACGDGHDGSTCAGAVRRGKRKRALNRKRGKHRQR